MKTLSDEEKHEVESYLTERDKGFAARQELAIRDSVSKHVQQIEDARKARFTTFVSIFGLSVVGALTLAGTLIANIAQDAARSAALGEVAAAKQNVSSALEQLNSAEDEIVKIRDEFSRIKQQSADTSALVLATERQIQQLKSDAEQILGQIQTAEGGVEIANRLLEVYEEMNELKFEVLKAELSRNRTASDTDPTQTAPSSAEGTIENLFPAND